MISKIEDCVGSKIKAFYNIINLWQVAVLLAKNSIEANSTAIKISFDPTSYSFVVVDNGCGMDPKVLNDIGNQALTTKPVEAGFRGQSLFYLSKCSKSLEILTKCLKVSDTITRKISSSNSEKCKISEKLQVPHTSGTIIKVDGVFDHLPVRRKVLGIEKQIEEIREQLQRLGLIHVGIQIAFQLSNEANVKFEIPQFKSHQGMFSYLFGLEKATQLQAIQFKSKNRSLDLNGYFLNNQKGVNNKQYQFFCKRTFYYNIFF